MSSRGQVEIIRLPYKTRTSRVRCQNLSTLLDEFQMQEIRTSNPKWVIELARCYKNKTPVTLIDDANLGINPETDTVLQMGRRANLGVAEWSAVAVSLGVAAAGVYLLVMAILDPEPFSKIGLALLAGGALTFGGGGMAVKVLTKIKPPNVKVGPGGFEISW